MMDILEGKPQNKEQLFVEEREKQITPMMELDMLPLLKKLMKMEQLYVLKVIMEVLDLILEL